MSAIFRADLHCHSTYSDGEFSPEELIALAVRSGLQGLAITDHDTVEAFAIAEPVARQAGLLLLPSCELSTTLGEESVHVLAYSFHPSEGSIAAFCKEQQGRRTVRNREILAKLAKRGFVLTEEEVSQVGRGVMGRPHIAQAMVARGYVSTVKEAFQNYLAEGKLCYAPGQRVGTQEAIDLIHAAGGKAIIAHPHLIQKTRLIRALTQLNFDGLEAYYAQFPLAQQQPWVKAAADKGWLATGGSDFHGPSLKPHLVLGCSWTPEEAFRQLYDLYQMNALKY